MHLLTQPIGTTKRHQLDLPSQDGADPVWTGAEPLTALAWPGDDRAPVVLTAEWVETPDRIALVVDAAKATALGIGRARFRVQVDGEWAADGWIDLIGSPAVAPADPTYATYKDLLKVAPWVAGLQETGDGSQAGFADVLADARRSLDDVILAKHARKSRSFRAEDGDCLLGGDRYSDWLRDRLAAGALVLTTQRGRRLIEAQAHDAAARIAARQWIAAAQEEMRHRATYHGRAAQSIYASGPAELDTDGDGRVDLAIHLGSFGT